MSVTLRIEFAGLCLYVLDKDKDGVTQRVGVVMPNCRNNDNNVDSRHADGSIGEPHVAYMRLDAASMGIGPSSGEAGDGPRVEVIHRLQGELILPKDASGQSVVGEPLVPVLNSRNDDIALKPKLFESAHPSIIFRTVLSGGRFINEGNGKVWRFPNSLRGTFSEQIEAFEGTVVWERDYASLEAVDLIVKDFDGRAEYAFSSLKPVGQHKKLKGRSLVRMKLANLCAHNPVEWDELDLRAVDEDRDFKWLFRLLDTTTHGDWATRLDDRPLPFPVLDPNSMEGDEDCTGAKFYGSF